MVHKNHSFHFGIIQVLGTVTVEESHNFNCITFLVTQLQFFSYYQNYSYYKLLSYSYSYY